MEWEAFIGALTQIVGPQAVVSAPDALRTYDADASMIVSHAPQLVALPSSGPQVAAIVRLAADYGLPVVARGAGTGIAGGAIALRGGIVLSSARLDRIEQIEPRNRWAIVQSGVVNSDLNARLAPLGYQFAPDPSSQRASTIGGNLGTNAGGPHCLKYGVTTNHILAVEIALHDGSLLWTGDGVAEQAGYDITGLIVGSEGTFGVVTRAKVRLTRLPEANRVVLALFPGVVYASAAVSQIIAAGHVPTSLEVMDHNAIRAVNSAYSLGLPESEGTTLLIIEVDGVEDGLDQSLQEVLEICEEHAAFELRPARTPEEQARVWTARKSVAGAIGRLAPAYYLVDAVVPRTRLPLMMEHIERLRKQHRLEVCNVFHAGDGNLHTLVLYDPRDADQAARAHTFAAEVLELSIAQGGVISGEHGIGVEKQNYLPLLMSPADLQLQATVYQVFNPAERFNPAKIFPTSTSPQELAAERQRRIADCRLQIADLPGQFAIDQPRIQPQNIEELCAAVAACHRAGLAIHPTGHAAAAPTVHHSPSTIPIVTRALKRVLTYEPDDQTIGVEAGMSMAELGERLAEHGQLFPIEVAEPANITIGALIATATDDPRRLGYGALRDLVLGLTIVEPDGTLVKLGAQVVKNVTGYDLVKLYLGSRGTLGVIAAAALRIFPRPPRTSSLLLNFPSRAAAMALLDDLTTRHLQPVAVEYLQGIGAGVAIPYSLIPIPYSLALRLEGSAPAVARHLRELSELAARHKATDVGELNGQAAEGLWASVAAHTTPAVSNPAEALLRLSVPPAELGAALEALEQLAAEAGMQLGAICARALNGVIYARAYGSATGLAALQQALSARWKHSHILAGDPAYLIGLPRWGAPPATLALMQALKQAIDPYAIMNPETPIV